MHDVVVFLSFSTPNTGRIILNFNFRRVYCFFLHVTLCLKVDRLNYFYNRKHYLFLSKKIRNTSIDIMIQLLVLKFLCCFDPIRFFKEEFYDWKMDLTSINYSSLLYRIKIETLSVQILKVIVFYVFPICNENTVRFRFDIIRPSTISIAIGATIM